MPSNDIGCLCRYYMTYCTRIKHQTSFHSLYRAQKETFSFNGKPFTQHIALFPTLNEFQKIEKLLSICRNPNGDNVPIKWKAFQQEEPSYLQINENLKVCKGYINEERYKFWEKINKIIVEGKIENDESEVTEVAKLE